MRFYLAQWIGDGTEGNEYRPNVDSGAWAAIDLRPDATRQEGRVLVAAREAVTGRLPRDVVDLGETLDEAQKVPSLRGIESALGVTLDGQSLRQIIAELLILHGESDLPGRSRWKRLKATRRGRYRIVMLGETIYDAPAVVGATIQESFDKADSDILGPDLAWVEVQGDIDVVSNQAKAGSGGTTSRYARAEPELVSDDHYAKVTIVDADATSGVPGVCVRCNKPSPDDAANSEFYHGRVNYVSTDTWEIFKVLSGAFTSLASGTTSPSNLATAEPYTFETRVDGSTLSVHINDVQQGSTTDTDITGNRRCGIRMRHAADTMDDFEAGDLGAAPTVHDLEGTIAGAATFDGSLVRVRDLSGDVGATASLSADLTPRRTLEGTVAASATLAGDLEIIAGAVELAGSVAATADLDGTLTRIRTLAGAVDAVAALTGDLTPRRVLSGTVDATADLAGALARIRDLSGSVDAEAVLRGDLFIGEPPPSLVWPVSSVDAWPVSTSEVWPVRQ